MCKQQRQPNFRFSEEGSRGKDYSTMMPASKFTHPIGKPLTALQNLVIPRKKNLEVFPDDIFPLSYPRSGNIWVVYLTANTIQPERERTLSNINEAVPGMYIVSEQLDSYPRPCIIKSHEPYQRQYPRVTGIYRDGRDVAISYYNCQQTIAGYKDTFDQFLGEYVQGNVLFESWQDHMCAVSAVYG